MFRYIGGVQIRRYHYLWRIGCNLPTLFTSQEYYFRKFHYHTSSILFRRYLPKNNKSGDIINISPNTDLIKANTHDVPSGINNVSRRDPLPDKNEIKLYGTSPNDILKSLKHMGMMPISTFLNKENSQNSKDHSDDIIISYLRSLQIGFKKSKANLSKLSNNLNSIGNNSEDNDNEKFKWILQYLIDESALEIKRLQTFSVDQLMEFRLNFEMGENNTANKHNDGNDFLQDFLINSQQAINTDSFYLNNTIFLLKLLNDIIRDDVPNWNKIIDVDQLVTIFELSKTNTVENWKTIGIYLSASLIYKFSTKNNKKIRMDPINESFYINSMIKLGYTKNAIRLFQSNKFIVNQRWWNELGLLLLLMNNNIKSFQNLLMETDSNFKPENNYLSPRILKYAIKKYSKVSSNSGRNFIFLKSLLQRFITMVKTFGIVEQRDVPQDLILFQNEKEGYEYLNEYIKPTYDDFISITNSLLYNKHVGLIGSFLQNFLSSNKVDSTIWQVFFIKTKLNLLKDFNEIKSLLSGPKPTLNDSNDVLIDNLNDFEETFKDMTSKYRDMNDSVVNQLVFDSINDLISNYQLPVSVYKTLAAMISQDQDNMELSKKINTLLKSLLAQDKILPAKAILANMEESFKLQNNKCKLNNNIPDKTNAAHYPPVTAHHYATFISYFSGKISRSKNKRTWIKYEKKVIGISRRFNELEIPYNSNYLSKLIQFYRQLNNFDRCFQIINESLYNFNSQNQENTHGNSDRNDMNVNTRSISQRLYFEIWKTYYEYYKVLSLELINARNRTKIKSWKRFLNCTKKNATLEPKFNIIQVLSMMTNKDNILPNPQFVSLILKTFYKSRNWASLPAVVSKLMDVFNIDFSDRMIATLLLVMEKEFITVETERQLRSNPKMTFIDAKIIATEEANKLKKKGLILSSDFSATGVDSKNILERIILLIKYINPYDIDFNDVRNAYEELDIVDYYPKSLIDSCK